MFRRRAPVRQAERVENILRFLALIASLNLQPPVILIDGSFVTGRVACHDVDAALLVPPENLLTALTTVAPDGVNFILNVLRSPGAVRATLGVHGFAVWDEATLQCWSNMNGHIRKRGEGAFQSIVHLGWAATGKRRMINQ